MSPHAARILVEKIMPVIQGTAKRVARPLPTEDREEVLQDALATAASFIDSIERAGKLHEIKPNSVAFFAIQRAKSARRFGPHRPNDVLSMARRAIPGREPASLNAEIQLGKDKDSASLLDFLPSRVEDPATLCARRLDWSEFISSLDSRSVRLLLKLAHGTQKQDAAKSLGISSARVSQLKSEIAAKAKRFFGVDSLRELSMEPEWKKRLRAFHESKAFSGIVNSIDLPRTA
jgi:hypothetical protein